MHDIFWTCSFGPSGLGSVFLPFVVVGGVGMNHMSAGMGVCPILFFFSFLLFRERDRERQRKREREKERKREREKERKREREKERKRERGKLVHYKIHLQQLPCRLASERQGLLLGRDIYLDP
jgi:uncharacterized membrane protein